MLQDNRALAETIYGDQQALVNIYDENGNILQTTTFVDAMENTLLPIVNYKTLNKPCSFPQVIRDIFHFCASICEQMNSSVKASACT